MRSSTTAWPARPWPLASLALLGLLGAGPSHAAAPLASATIRVTVTVVEKPSCVINGNRPIEVDFGEVMTSKIDGAQYKVPVTYSLECKQSEGKNVRMNILANPSAFDPSALATSVAGLGIRLYAADQVLPPGPDGYRFVYPNLPVLTAVPVKDAAITLAGGDFSAAATLEVEYL